MEKLVTIPDVEEIVAWEKLYNIEMYMGIYRRFQGWMTINYILLYISLIY